jgi:dephospho-CoA kinase
LFFFQIVCFRQFASRMKVIGLTGGIGMGKSTVASMIAGRGIDVVDTDDLARRVVEPGQPALDEIRQLFGAGVIGADGALLRQELARRVFGSEVSRRQLEAVLHPRIRGLWRDQIEQWRELGKPTGFVVIPLLFETRSERNFDGILCVACSKEQQEARLLRRGMSVEQIRQRNEAQWPIAKKMEAADAVIWNEYDPTVAGEQLERYLVRLGIG